MCTLIDSFSHIQQYFNFSLSLSLSLSNCTQLVVPT